MDFMTREVFDWLIVSVILIGAVLAARRLQADFTRPLPEDYDYEERPSWSDEDTAERLPPVNDEHLQE